MSDQVGNQNVGFLMMRLKGVLLLCFMSCYSYFIHLILQTGYSQKPGEQMRHIFYDIFLSVLNENVGADLKHFVEVRLISINNR